jgi:antitoxin component YwqK of YwqJK toxin-antitoxin module
MRILVSIFIFTALQCAAQSFEIFNSDTINRRDTEGKKQGKWIVRGLHKPGTCYKDNQKIEEGTYLNNRKTGSWTEYYCNGNLKNQLTFIDGHVNGEACMYHENGALSETGTWKKKRWLGSYTQYDEKGNVIRKNDFDSTGRIYGSRTNCRFYFDPETVFIKYTKCNMEFTLNGDTVFYNERKQITTKGFFDRGSLINGKVYVYNNNYSLKRIAVYKNGSYIGDTQE